MKFAHLYSIATLVITGFFFVASADQRSIYSSMTEQCAMASMGYEFAGTTKLEPVDKYALARTFLC